MAPTLVRTEAKLGREGSFSTYSTDLKRFVRRDAIGKRVVHDHVDSRCSGRRPEVQPLPGQNSHHPDVHSVRRLAGSVNYRQVIGAKLLGACAWGLRFVAIARDQNRCEDKQSCRKRANPRHSCASAHFGADALECGRRILSLRDRPPHHEKIGPRGLRHRWRGHPFLILGSLAGETDSWRNDEKLRTAGQLDGPAFTHRGNHTVDSAFAGQSREATHRLLDARSFSHDRRERGVIQGRQNGDR